MKRNEFIKSLNVSRETLKGFYEYKTLLAKWNEKINLVSKNTLVDIWGRHFLDSGQIIQHVEASGKRWVDVGSGAGFPGLVVALLLRDRKIDCDLVLVEKNPKKCFFLNEIIRKLKLSKVNPQHIHEASKIDGMTPSGLMLLISKINSYKKTA